MVAEQSFSKENKIEGLNALSGQVIDSAIHVHRKLGPGLLESACQHGLSYILAQRNIVFEKEKIVEIKSVHKILSIHEAQLLTYMKLGNYKLGLLLNFNEKLLKDGIKRMVL